MHKMKYAALYIRVSTDKQEELSPDAQKRELIKYAKHNGYSIDEEYIFMENGISGKLADKRPQFQRMIGMAKSKERPFEAILVWKFSRFARNQEESIVYKSLLKKNGVDVISISEPLIDGPFGSLIERIIEWMDEYYSIRLAGEVTRGMTEKALKGGYQASPPLGYEIIRSGDLPVIVPDEAAIVKTIFDKYVIDGLSFYQIAKYLNSMGLKTKQGKLFERRAIEYVIQNPMYKGYIRWNRTHHASNTVKGESEWIIRKASHEPIISEELFDAAQVKAKIITIHKKARPNTEYKSWLSGILKCSACGRSLVVSQRADMKSACFQCNGYNKGKCSVSHFVSDNKITPIIIDIIKKATVGSSFTYSIERQTESKDDTSLLEQQLNRIKTKEERIKAAYMNGIDTIQEYKSNKELIQKEKAAIQEQIDIIRANLKKDYTKEMQQRIYGLYNIITSETADQETKNNAMKSVIDKIVYNKKEETVDIYFIYRSLEPQ